MAVKTLHYQIGGTGIYTRLRPLFLGLVLGAFGSAGFWLLVSATTGVHGLVFTLGILNFLCRIYHILFQRVHGNASPFTKCCIPEAPTRFPIIASGVKC